MTPHTVMITCTMFMHALSDMYIVDSCMYARPLLCLCVCERYCTAVMGKCQNHARVPLLSINLYPPSNCAGPSPGVSLGHVYTANQPLFHTLFVLLLHTSSSINLSPLSCIEQKEGALLHYSNMPFKMVSLMLTILLTLTRLTHVIQLAGLARNARCFG